MAISGMGWTEVSIALKWSFEASSHSSSRFSTFTHCDPLALLNLDSCTYIWKLNTFHIFPSCFLTYLSVTAIICICNSNLSTPPRPFLPVLLIFLFFCPLCLHFYSPIGSFISLTRFLSQPSLLRRDCHPLPLPLSHPHTDTHIFNACVRT